MHSITLGIDIACRTFAVALLLERNIAKAEFENNSLGFRKLRTWMKRHGTGHVRAGLESTSIYGDALADWLHKEGHQVFMLNPERTAHFARSLGQRNKTDPADAVMIARYVAQNECTLWQPPVPEQRTLRSLTRTRHQLVDCATELSHQLRTADATARPHLQAALEAVRKQLKIIAREIKQHLKVHPQLGEQVRRLMTMKGVGLVTAAITVAELPPITETTDPRAICGWAGMTPRRWQSGQMEGRTRISRKGNAYIRHAFYLPALVAKRRNPLFAAYAQSLAQRGKSHGAILGAVAHKMLRTLVGMLRTKTDFNPNWSYEKTG